MSASFIADYCVLFGLALLLVNFYVTATSQIEGATKAIRGGKKVDPKPETLNPKPETLNPKPETPNTKPLTLKAEQVLLFCKVPPAAQLKHAKTALGDILIRIVRMLIGLFDILIGLFSH